MKENGNKNLMMIAGEVSGDLHGSSLVKELKKMDRSLNIYGVGGDRMKSEGMELVYHIDRMAFLGFAEVVKHLPFIRRVQSDLIEVIKKKKIKSVVLIDYPGFNLNFAKKLKALNINIIYYISPQIWAWGSRRIKKIKRLINKMIVVFPFEEKFYKDSGVDVEFAGHPLIERIGEYQFLSKEELYKKFDLDWSKDILLILPGSRLHEVERIFPEAIKAADKLAAEFGLQILIAASPNIKKEIYSDLSGKIGCRLIYGFTYDLMKYAKLGIIKSGTSTLESALFTLPMVIVYKTGKITYSIGKKLVKVNNIGMANIIAGEKIVPELIQNEANARNIYLECKKMLTDEGLYNHIRKRLSEIKEKLGTEGASQKAAAAIYKMI